MMKKTMIAIISVICLGVMTHWYIFTTQEEQVESVHYHAVFRVYLNNELQDFSDYRYMNFTPCQEHDEKKSAQEEQIEKAHLHDNVGDVVHVHREGATWGDLFANIGVELPQDIKSYVDGVLMEDYAMQPIEAYTTMILIAGNTSPERARETIAREYIEQIEAKSELCGS